MLIGSPPPAAAPLRRALCLSGRSPAARSSGHRLRRLPRCAGLCACLLARLRLAHRVTASGGCPAAQGSVLVWSLACGSLIGSPPPAAAPLRRALCLSGRSPAARSSGVARVGLALQELAEALG